MSSLERDTSPFPPSDRPLSRIGRKGKPIRVLSFAGSGFDAAMQLGVVHALLVSRARAPDIVIGASVGAVSAVALAEVLQASDVDDPGPRVARFRELFEAYRRAPGEIRQALVPDPVQVDTQRPLETLRLPVHHERERAGRRSAVASRAGLINLYNTLLNIRLTVGTIARGVRCWLGIRGGSEIRDTRQKLGLWIGEGFRAWLLLGVNLHNAATLLSPLVRAALPWKRRRDEGATAAELIFASSAWRQLWRRVSEGFWTLVLIVAWLTVSGIAAIIIGSVSIYVLDRFGAHPPVPVAFAIGLLVVTTGFILMTRARQWRLVLPILAGVASVLLLMVLWTTVLAVVLAVPLLLVSAYRAFVSDNPAAFWWPWHYSSYWITAPTVLLIIGALTALGLGMRGRDLGRSVLALYDLDDSLFDPDALRQFLVRVFDAERYNVADSATTIERALADDNTPHGGNVDAKLVGEYAFPERPSSRLYTRPDPTSTQDPEPPPAIHVAVAVADVASGKLVTIPPYVHVVTALLAALAKPPFFPAVSCFGRLLVDATALTYEPTQALLGLLRESNLIESEAAVVHLYTVAPFPFGQPALGPEFEDDGKPRRYTRLLDVLRRVLLLRRFRDATLERRLTELHTWAMPQHGSVRFRVQDREFLRVWVYPIEPERPLTVTYKTLQTNTEEERRQIMAETVATGCRAALEMMIQPAISAQSTQNPDYGSVSLCRQALKSHFIEQDVYFPPLPGSTPPPDNGKSSDVGPGIAEVCEHCQLFQKHGVSAKPPKRSLQARAPHGKSKDPSLPTWPAAQADEKDWTEPSRTLERPSAEEKAQFAALREEWSGKWPMPRPGVPPDQRSTVSLLFSGGVFRGVFQVGVLNAISEASLRPDVVAGASVGSITSAMAARAFITPGLDGAEALKARRAFIRRLAAAYLAIDRLILTDRFADFVRGFTVRAAQARFSVRDADRVLRRFDAANPWTFSREVRRVLAGFDRLAYVSPFELRDVVEAFRRGQVGTGTRLLEDHFQELLDRAGVGQEVLGAEPLERLINDFVLEGLAPPGVRPAHATFQELLDHGIFFFATATNLTDGRLHAWGDDQLLSVGRTPLNLLQALLASSAFPGVFRRRWSWEVLSGTPHPHEYADGGVMDNLPLDAVAHFLDSAADIPLIARRPGVPHLLLSASLETAPRPITSPDVLAGLCENWPRLRSRTGELAYNRKVELFERTQENLRWMMDARDKSVDPDKVWTPLDLEVLTIVPRWLCGTMAFHPMLGFRRSNEAESIAHGCAATLLALGKRVHETADGPARITAWAMEKDWLPSPDQSLASDPFIPLVPLTKKQTGNCWYRPRVICPFSYAGQGRPEKGSISRTGYELHEIYLECGRITTHRPR